MRAAAFALGRRAAGAAGATGASAFPSNAGRALAPALAPLARHATASSGFATSAVARARRARAPRALLLRVPRGCRGDRHERGGRGVAGAPARAKEAVPIASLPFSKVTLYQYDVQASLCNKVKAMLDFHGVPYDVVEVNPLTKSEMAFSKEYKKVLVLVVDGTQINNSARSCAGWKIARRRRRKRKRKRTGAAAEKENGGCPGWTTGSCTS